jgi:hypothetical protein
MSDATSRNAFLNKQTVNNGRRPKKGTETLDKVLTMYQELRASDRSFTLNMLADEVRRMDSGSKDLSLSAIRRRIYRHLRKYGVFRRHVTRVAQNTRYDEGVKAGYVAFVSAWLTVGKYKASDIVNIDEMNVDFDLVSGSTSAGRKEKKIGCATTGSSLRCTPSWCHNGWVEVTAVHHFQGCKCAAVSYQEGFQGCGGSYQVWLSWGTVLYCPTQGMDGPRSHAGLG